MKKKADSSCPIPKRLRDARTETRVSQKRLGILAGMDEFSASSRVNQYETGKHVPDYKTAKRMADALNIPVTYLYAEDDDMAALILLLHKSSKSKRKQVIKLLKT